MDELFHQNNMSPIGDNENKPSHSMFQTLRGGGKAAVAWFNNHIRFLVSKKGTEKARQAVFSCGEKVSSATVVCINKVKTVTLTCCKGIVASSVTVKDRLASSETKEALIETGSKAKAAVQRHPISPLLYTTIIAILIGFVLFRSTYISAYAVNVDGVEIGVVTDTEDVEETVSLLEDWVSNITGTTYEFEGEVAYTPVFSTEDELTDTAEIGVCLYEMANLNMEEEDDAVSLLIEGYALCIDGTEVGVAASEEDLYHLLDLVAAPYLSESTVDYGFVEDVSISKKDIDADFEFDLDSIFDLLTETTVEEAVYTVESGDTFISISKSLDMTLSELEALNPDVNSSLIFIGQELLIQRSVPYLSVYTIDEETYESTIESPIEYTETPNLYIGETQVTEQGEEGLESVTANVTYVNGYEAEREVISTTTIIEPTVTQMLKGTTEKPKTASTGTYIYPVSGYTITSRYGYRGSEFHTGVDLAVPYGTAVKAADGGTVTYAGWQGNYGYLVIITHDNGAQTYYAHNSSLLVSVGDKVYQGQQIAKAGMTGRATGNHCHFELRINGSTVNPLNYLH